MSTILSRLPWRKKPTRTATEEVLEEVKEQGHEDDTDTGGGTGGGAGDPITPSLQANRKTAEGRPSDREP
ncbi:hypothetical protein [Streptomyces sp. Ru72]|uniref:hypothetical protein n=1 Tax=Streptomyces sp. Ru72 TaxID=2080747 RepID=UPI000CDDC3C7|nr:hypothetical protein [Streptomyces sp. Ru72]POX43696.1 hypothetical protein C3488_35570 [Streptomyces sp. Ru72]